MAEKRKLYEIEWDLETKFRHERDSMPLWGPKGKVARASFLCLGLLLCVGVSIRCSGFADSILPSLLLLGKVTAFVGIPLLIPSAVYLTWRETWGRRFPLSAVAALALLVSLCAACAWMAGQYLAGGPVLDIFGSDQGKDFMGLCVLYATDLVFGAAIAVKFAIWLDDMDRERIKREARAVYEAENAPESGK